MLTHAAASTRYRNLDPVPADASSKPSAVTRAECVVAEGTHVVSSARFNGVAQSAKYTLIEQRCLDRQAAEEFISQSFAHSFNARIHAFMPRLFTVRNVDGHICGALGLRSAQRNLFVEQYLDSPVEKTITARTGESVKRAGIVEVGHLSGAFPGAMRALILLLIERLHCEGFEWVAFTGTTQLRNAFHRLGLDPIDLGIACVEAIPLKARAAWGAYYDHAPRVLAGKIGRGLVALRRSGGFNAATAGSPA